MNRNRRAFRFAACCMTAAITLGSTPAATYADMPVAGAPAVMSIALEDEVKSAFVTVSAGISLNLADCVSAAAAEAALGKKSEYADIAIAQVDNYVNVRDSAGEEGNVVGKLYNNSAATVEAVEGDWYKITSGNVTGFVKSEFVVRDNEELAKEVSRRIAKVETEPTVAIEEGEAYVANDFVNKSVEFVTAESKEEEEARLAKEEAERKAAAEAAEKASASRSKGSSSGSSGKTSRPSGSGGSAVANYACQFVGNPYVYGGTSLTNGADCSGFVMSVYAAG